MRRSGLIPSNKPWKSNFVRLICLTSNSVSPELFVRRLVRSLYNRLTNISFPLDLKLIGDLLDIKSLETESLSDDIDSMLLPYKDGYKIIINSDGPKNIRLSICHEFAHILIERYFSKIDLSCSNTYLDTSVDYFEEERLCQKIGSEILIPGSLFREEALKLKPSVYHLGLLAETFQASCSAIIRKLLETKSWHFDFVYWSIRDDYIYPIESWNPCGHISNHFLHRIVNDSYALRKTYETRTASSEDWLSCLVDHMNITPNNVISFFWNKD